MGITKISYKNPNDKYKSFEGVGMFYDGQLHNGSFTCINGFGRGYLYNNMQFGRPAENTYITYFNKPGEKQLVDTAGTRVDVSGLQYYSGQLDKENRNNGKGKIWSPDGSVFIGEYKDDFKTQGHMYELQPNGTYTLYDLKCNLGNK